MCVPLVLLLECRVFHRSLSKKHFGTSLSFNLGKFASIVLVPCHLIEPSFFRCMSGLPKKGECLRTSAVEAMPLVSQRPTFNTGKRRWFFKSDHYAFVEVAVFTGHHTHA